MDYLLGNPQTFELLVITNRTSFDKLKNAVGEYLKVLWQAEGDSYKNKNVHEVTKLSSMFALSVSKALDGWSD